MNEVATLTHFDAAGSVLGEARHVQDANGGRLQDGQFKLYFDAFERLVRVERASDGVVVGRYRYDAAGRRVDRQFRVGGGPLQQVFHVHDGAQEVEEIDGAGAVQADFVWGGLYVDQLVQMRRGGGTYYAHQNSVFSVVALTDASGAVAERYGYSSVFGVCQVQNADGSSRSSASEVGNPWRFQGRRFDPETGWLYFRARFLDPAAGRWVSRDPLGIWGDAGQIGNAYSFCGNDPVNGMDPSGLWGIGPGYNPLNGLRSLGGEIEQFVDRSPLIQGGIEFFKSIPDSVDVGGKVLADTMTLGRSDSLHTAATEGLRDMGLTNADAKLVYAPAVIATGATYAAGALALAPTVVATTSAGGATAWYTSGSILTKASAGLTSAFFAYAATAPAWLQVPLAMAVGLPLIPGSAPGDLSRGLVPGGPGTTVRDLGLGTIGTSPKAPDFYSVPNAGGGRVFVTSGTTVQPNFAGLVNPANARGPVVVLTGVHGTESGGTSAAPAFFTSDKFRFQTLGPGNVTVLDITKLSPTQISAILNGRGRIICAWCMSDRSGLVIRGLAPQSAGQPSTPCDK